MRHKFRRIPHHGKRNRILWAPSPRAIWRERTLSLVLHDPHPVYHFGCDTDLDAHIYTASAHALDKPRRERGGADGFVYICEKVGSQGDKSIPVFSGRSTPRTRDISWLDDVLMLSLWRCLVIRIHA